MTNQIIEVPDISIVKTVEGTKRLFSLRNQKIKKETLQTWGAGSGLKYDGNLYVLSSMTLSGKIEQTPEGVYTIELFIGIYADMTNCVAKLQLKDELNPEWRDYKTLDIPESGECILSDGMPSGIYRVVVLNTLDYSEKYSSELSIYTETPIRMLSSNNIIMHAGYFVTLKECIATIPTDEYLMEYFTDEWGWIVSVPGVAGTGEPMEWNKVMDDGLYRCRAMTYPEGRISRSNEVLVKKLDQLILCDTEHYDIAFLENGDKRCLISKSDGGYDDFSLTFAVCGVVYDSVKLKRFNIDTLLWEEIANTGIIMENQDQLAEGTFIVNQPGRYKAEAVNTTTGEKTDSNFILLMV